MHCISEADRCCQFVIALGGQTRLVAPVPYHLSEKLPVTLTKCLVSAKHLFISDAVQRDMGTLKSSYRFTVING